MPKGSWEIVHLDFYGPLSSGEYLLVVIDRYSRFPEVEIVRSTKESRVIPKLDKIFGVHGIPSVINSDNGPPFNGDEHKKYLEVLGVKPEFATPYWPERNAEAERFMQPLGKAIKTAHIQGSPWQQELSRFLLLYRAAPHTTTGVPPSELLFYRTVRESCLCYKNEISSSTREFVKMRLQNSSTTNGTQTTGEMQIQVTSKNSWAFCCRCLK